MKGKRWFFREQNRGNQRVAHEVVGMGGGSATPIEGGSKVADGRHQDASEERPCG